MATQPIFLPECGYLFRHACTRAFRRAVFFAVTTAMPFATKVGAQLQQPLVYTTGGAIAMRNDASGTLTPTVNSPLAVLGFPAVIDSKGRFLFAAGNDSIHMYNVDSVTGAYTEVSGSPFASGTTNGPMLLATEPTGTYLAVVNSTGLNPGESSVESFQIDAANQALLPVSGSFLELVSTPVGAAANPALGTFYVYLGTNPASPNPFYQQDGDLLTYTIDPLTGFLGDETGTAGSNNHGRSFGADPLGRFVVTGQGQLSGTLQVTSASGAQGILNVGSGVYPQEVFVGPGRHFVYATLFAAPSSVVHIYIVDTTTWMLTEAPSSPLPGFTSVANLIADPTGQFVYQSTAPNQVRVHAVDLSTGYLTEIPDSPFTGPGMGLPVAFSIVPGIPIQPEVGPVATLTPPGLTLGTANVGAPTPAQTITLSSTGNQALILNGIAVAGANATEFSESDDCIPVLAPTQSCAISIIFTPGAAGPRSAQLGVTDNAPGSPQMIALSGTGAGSPPTTPAISFSATTLNFPSVSQGSSSSPLTLTVTNAGNAPLNISTIVLGGNNAGDFNAPSGNCLAGAVAPNASCVVMETFTPLAAGSRAATLAFTDNAPGSPHSVNLLGTGTNSPTTGPAVKFIPTAISFPVTTQGLASTPVSVNVTNTGTAPLHISNVSAGGSSPAEFSNVVSACSSATIAPNASCSISVTFAPVSSGSRSETLSVTDDAANSPHVFNISATAAPAFTVSSPASTLSASISAGQTATYSLQLTPGLDFNGTISFTCTGAPLAAICKVPSSVTLNVGAPATLTVTVPTSGKAELPPTTTVRRSSRRPMQPDVFRIAVAMLICVWVLLWNALTKWPGTYELKPGRMKRAYALTPLLPLILVVLATGCTGNITSAPVPQGDSVVTPSGTSMLVLTPTATNAAGKALQLPPIQLTLVVN